MAQAETRLPVKTGVSSRVFDNLRREVERVFDVFDGGFFPPSVFRPALGPEPAWLPKLGRNTILAVDIAETGKAYEISAELPGLNEKDIEVRLSNGGLIIKGEKQEQTEETKKDYYLQERRFGSFERSFALPDGIDTGRIEAKFANGVLTVTLPKSAEAQKTEKKIAVRAA